MSKSSRRKARARQRTKRASKRVAAPPTARPRTATAKALANPPKKAERPTAAAPARATGPTTADALHGFLSKTGILRISAVARRDITALFVSPVGWVVAGAFVILVSGFGFIAAVVEAQRATLDGVFAVITNFLVVVLAPLLTMRVLAEEKAQGTLELLLTSPVRDWELIAGKWAGAFAFYLLLLATTFVDVAILRFYAGALDVGLTGALYIGLVVIGAAATAVGVFASSLTRNQVVAFLAAVALLLMAWYAAYAIGIFVPAPANQVFQYAGGYYGFQSFMLGQAALRDIVYFVTLTLGALFLATRVLASRRWP
jgi:gliding motility-associated transport system permease protein